MTSVTHTLLIGTYTLPTEETKGRDRVGGITEDCDGVAEGRDRVGGITEDCDGVAEGRDRVGGITED